MNCTELKRILVLGASLLVLMTDPAVAGSQPSRFETITPLILELAGPLTDRQAEVSGMTWKGDTLVVLPQDPTLFAAHGQLGFFVLTRQEISAAINGAGPGPIRPRQVTCRAPGLSRLVRGFDGLEAIGLMDGRWYMTVEAKEDTATTGYLVSGDYDVNAAVVVMDMNRVTVIPMGLNVPNLSEETLVVDGDRIITISEANGRYLNPNPVGKIFDANLDFQGTLPLPRIEYRVTDATEIDSHGCFWVINYFYPPERDKLQPAADPELERFADGAAPDPDACVERLLELQLVRRGTPDEAIVRTATPPLNLTLLANGECRNWEAVARLDNRGFLLMTDQYPGTLLAFVPYEFKP